MSTFYSQGSGNWSTTTNWDTNAGGGGTDPASGDEAGMDNHTYIIQAGHTITLDLDMSAWANGVAGLTIESHATTPGMLCCSTSAGAYCIKVKTGTAIAGTNAAAFGRILANSDKVWGNTGAVPTNITFLILLNTTAYIDAQYLDIALRCTEPTYKSVQTYGTKATVDSINTGTDVITCTGAHGWSANTAVKVRSSGTLPGGLTANDVYYVTSPSGADLKLALQSGGTAVDITSSGSGTIEIYSGYTSGSATVNVLTDVTGDSQWASGASVVLSNDYNPGNYDQQRVTINGAPTSTQIVLSAAVDSTQYPGAGIWLMTRNVAIRSNTTSTSVYFVQYASGSTHGGVLGCEIRATAGTGTTFYGNGTRYGVGVTISGTISGCTSGCTYGSNHTISGIISGCTYGCTYGSNHTISGTISGCTYGCSSGSNHTISGTISGCTYGCNSGSNHTISGTISGCTYGFNYGLNHTISGTISGCTSGCSSGLNNTLSGMISGCTSDFRIGDDGPVAVIVKGRASIQNPPVFYNRNSDGYGKRGIQWEDFNGTLGASYAFLNTGDIIKNTVTVRPTGADSSIEVVPLSGCSATAEIPIFEWTELDVPEDSELTKTIYIKGEGWTSFPTNTQLYFEAEYLNHASLLTVATVTSTEVLTDNTTWTALTVTFTPLQVGPVRYRAFLNTYEAACKVYVDNALYTS